MEQCQLGVERTMAAPSRYFMKVWERILRNWGSPVKLISLLVMTSSKRQRRPHLKDVHAVLLILHCHIWLELTAAACLLPNSVHSPSRVWPELIKNERLPASALTVEHAEDFNVMQSNEDI